MEEYPDLVIELSSHTDYQGQDRYNMSLSRRRADAARRWLIARGGIEAARIKFEGYGETQPTVVSDRLSERTGFPAGDTLTEAYIRALPPEQQDLANQINRRTEFKVLEGPTSIIIRRDVIERAIEGPDRKGLPRPPQGRGVSDSIHPMSSLHGKPAEEVAALPVLVFEERQQDIGSVRPGDKREFSYTFTNRGQVPAKVMLIQACDCTTVVHDDSRVYQPGESGTIQVIFDSATKTEGETLGIDIFLEQEHPATGQPVTELLEYSYEIAE
jgi:hypothetical protein